MPNLFKLIAISSCYFLFAILLNSVGTVILQSIHSFSISKPEASILEGLKDLSIAFVSFAIAAILPKIGYKFALLIGLSLVFLACLFTPIFANFLAIKVLFACIGVSFALVKVSVYAVIGLISHSTKQHASIMNTVEGIFMLGSLTGYWLFGFFSGNESQSWLQVYYVLAGLTFVTLLLVVFSGMPNKQAGLQNSSNRTAFIAMLKLSYQPLILIFVISVFLYVLVEQSIGTWLPTFNKEVLALPIQVSVQMASIFAAALAVGRLLAGQVLKYVNWFEFLIACLLAMAVLIISVLPLTHGINLAHVHSVTQVHWVAYLLPLIGLFMAPIYPVLNSVMLSNLAQHQHAAMTGLIVVFSALGGTTGSLITGVVFQWFDGRHAFYFSLIPITMLTVSLWLFRQKTQQHSLHTHLAQTQD